MLKKITVYPKVYLEKTAKSFSSKRDKFKDKSSKLNVCR